MALDAIHRYLSGHGDLPAQSVAITLDDGFEDNCRNALPILNRRGMLAMVCLVSGAKGKSNMWMHQRGFPRHTLLSWAQARDMSRCGIAFGAHTVSHPRLPELTATDARTELADSKKCIEDEIGPPVNRFACPFGLYTEAACELVRETGYATASSNRPGFNTRDTDRYGLRRIDLLDTMTTVEDNQRVFVATGGVRRIGKAERASVTAGLAKEVDAVNQ